MDQLDSNENILERVLYCLKKFDPTKEHFNKWLDVVELILDMFKIKNDRRSYILLNLLEYSVFIYVRLKVEPNDPFNIPYEMIVSILIENYSPYGKYQSLMYRLTFRDQFKEESIENYYHTLKKLMDKLDNGPDADSNLLFRFIYGLQNEEIRKNLLETPNLTIYSAIIIAMKIEFRIQSPVMNRLEDKWFHLLHELKKEEECARQTRIMDELDSNENILERVLCCLKKFDPTKEHFNKWLDVVELILNKLKIKNDRRSYILLNVLESSVFTYVRSHVEPDDPFNIPYEMIVSIIEEKYSPYGEYQSLMYRLTFRDQFKDESIENYYYTLKKLMDKLDNGPDADSNLLFRFIYGLQNEEIRKNLLETPNLTNLEAIVIATKIELKNRFVDIEKSRNEDDLT